ncbi:MAG: NAD(P)/FAD-dependent oxidoreductase, partial [Planctomycetota bacterium]
MTRAAQQLGPGRRRIAVIGSGISGLVAARLLSTRHDVTVYEAEPRIGGHTHTVDVDVDGHRRAIDTGFIVFNDRNYPAFSAMLERLGVASRPTTMSFSVRCERTGLEYNGGTPNQLFAQRRNLLRPAFWGMLRDILRFHREAPKVLRGEDDPSVAELLLRGRYGQAFTNWYLVPMAAAIWSAEPHAVLSMPARFLLRFFHNHGMLQVRGRPQWRTVVGGSRSYLGPLSAPFADRIERAAPVRALWRAGEGVHVDSEGRPPRVFDGVVLATHSDQALRLLRDPSADEARVLGAIRYQRNEVVLHTDRDLLPRRRRAWAAWNYHLPRSPQDTVAVTYCMNLLQGLPEDPLFCVTLNRPDAVDPARVL